MRMTMHMAAVLVPTGPLSRKEKRHAEKRPAPEADKLPLGEIEHDLRFYFGQVFWYWYISHLETSLPI